MAASLSVALAEASITTNESAPQFRQMIGTRGSAAPAPGDVRQPEDLAVAPNGDLYIADTDTHRIVRRDSAGAFLSVWGDGEAGSEPGQFDHPSGIAVAASGEVYVADTGNDRVQRLSANGAVLSTWGADGSGDGQFRDPIGVAVGPDGNVWVTGTDCRVQRFTAEGEFVAGWGGCTVTPSGMHGIAIAADGTVHVASLDTSVVYHYSVDGVYLSSFGGSGSADGKFQGPSGLDIAADGTIYVADSGNRRVQQFWASGDFRAKWGSSGTGDGQFNRPRSVAVAPGGDVYVAAIDTTLDGVQSHPVQRFTAAGAFVAVIGGWGDGRARFAGPKDVAITADGGMVVVDTGNQRISVAGVDLVFDLSWGWFGSGTSEFVWPEAVAVGVDGDIYVADTGNHRVQRFTEDGTFVAQWGSPGTGPGQFDQPAGIDVDANGDVWVGDRGNDRVQRFSKDGAFQASFGTTGSGPDQFDAPSAVAVSDDAVFVADTGNARVQRLGLDGSFDERWTTSASTPPVGLAADQRSGVWVVGQGTALGSTLSRFSSDGVLLSLFNDPKRGRGVAIGADGHVFVADEYHLVPGVAEFEPDGGALLAVTLRPAAPSAEVGRRIDYQLVVRNTGTEDLTGIDATYTGTPECDGPLPDLPPGESLERTCSHLARAADVGTFANQVSVSSSQIPSPVQSVAADADVDVQFPAPTPLGVLGGPGTGPGQLEVARDLDVGPDGDLYVANRLAVGSFEADVFHEGSSSGAVPMGSTSFARLAVGAGGDLFGLYAVPHVYDVGDADADGARTAVRRFSPEGTAMGTVTGSVTDSAGRDIDAHGDGRVLMATEVQTVQWWDEFYGWQYEDFGDSSLHTFVPSSGTHSSAAGGGDAVASAGNHIATLFVHGSTNSVVHLRTNGVLASSFEVPGGGAVDLDVDAAGNVYVAYDDDDMVKVFSPSGLLLATWSTPADRIAVGPDGTVYVLDVDDSVVRVFGFGISGTVTADGPGTPVPDALVVAVDSLGAVAAATITDPGGSYRLPVGSGQYRVAYIDPAGAHDGEWATGLPLTDPTGGPPTVVGASGVTVDAALAPALGSLSGTVTEDGSGLGVPGAWVVAIDQDTGVVSGTVAAADGSYDLVGLSRGVHMAAFVDPSAQRRFEFFDDAQFAPFADPVTVVAGTDIAVSAGLASTPQPAANATIEGVIQDEDTDEPIPGAWVAIVGTDGALRGGAVADSSGHYSRAVPAGSYRVQAIDPVGHHLSEWAWNHSVDDYDGADIVTVAAAGTATVNVGLTSSRGSIAGTVDDPSGPSAGTLVVAISLATGAASGASSVAWDGTYEVDGLLPGQFLVAFVDPRGDHGFEYHDGAENPAAATPVAVAAAATTTVDAFLG